MINFEEELKKFHPSLEVSEALEELQGEDQTGYLTTRGYLSGRVGLRAVRLKFREMLI